MMLRIFGGLILVFVLSLFLLMVLDKRVNYILNQYVNIEVERYVNNAVSKVVRKKVKNLKNEDYLFLYNNKMDDFTKGFSYNTAKINLLKSELEDEIQKELLNLEDGKLDEDLTPIRLKSHRFKKIENGVICDISIGSIRGSSLFANVGPTVPIKLIFTGRVNSNIDFKIKEYGINNVIIETYIVFNIREQAIMPISSKTKSIVLQEPLSIDIISGTIPKYYGSYIK